MSKLTNQALAEALLPKQVLAEARARVKVREALEKKINTLCVEGLAELAERIKVFKFVKVEPPKPEAPITRFRITRRRFGIRYEAVMRKTLKAAEKLALSYFNGGDLQPNEVVVEVSHDPPYRNNLTPNPKWNRVLHLKRFNVKFADPRGGTGSLEVAAEIPSVARKRAEASLGIGYTILSARLA